MKLIFADQRKRLNGGLGRKICEAPPADLRPFQAESLLSQASRIPPVIASWAEETHEEN